MPVDATDQIRDLAARFGLPGQVLIEAGPGGLPVVVVHNTHATAAIALHGAHVLDYRPHGHEPVLFVSRDSLYTPGKAIRGGIPLCWPWFGPHPTDASKPAHGFARTRAWDLERVTAYDDGSTEVRLKLAPSAETLALWPHSFDLEAVVTVGPSLRLALVATNTDTTTFACSAALHSYVQVGDVTAIAVHGLDGTAYIDKVDADRRVVQHGAVTITGETDRVYLDTMATCTVDDPVLGRRIDIAKEGSHSTVVWNPWREKAARLADLGDDEYTVMMCVEVANALDDTIEIAPGGTHQLAATLTVAAPTGHGGMVGQPGGGC